MDNIDTTTFDLEGSHYDIGVAIGQGSPLFSLPAGWPEPPPLSFADACAGEIAAFHSLLIDEIRGHADGQAQSFDEMMRIICRQRLGGRIAPIIPEHGGCTSMVWRAPNGHMLVGRNYDFHSVQRIRQRIRLRPEGSRPTVGMRGSVPAGRYDGVNDAGLFVCLHIVLSDQPKTVRPGVPFHLVPRILLETCSTVKQALDTIMMMPHLHGFNYLIADANSAVAVECHADRIRILYPEHDVLAVGNFYRHPDMAPLQQRRQQLVSRQRVAFLDSGSWQRPDLDPWDNLKRAMQDHVSAVCGHKGGHTTLWSAVADLTAKRIDYTLGAPCCSLYDPITWPT